MNACPHNWMGEYHNVMCVKLDFNVWIIVHVHMKCKEN